jgi:hypothetical protein
MPTVLPIVIQSNSSMSEAVNLTGATAIVGIVMPEDWTPAVVTIQGSPDGVFFHDLHDGVPGTELAFNVSPDSLVMLNPNRMRSSIAVKLRSGTRAFPIAQKELRMFGIVVEGPVAPLPPPATGVCAHVIEDTSSDYHGLEQFFQAPGPMTCVLEVWFKSSNRQAGFEIYNGDGGSRVYFDLATSSVYGSSVYGSGFSAFTHEIEGPGPNGWWKCSATLDLHPISPGHQLRISIDQGSAGGQAYAGDGASFIQVWKPSLTLDGGANVLISPDDLTKAVWRPHAASVVNIPDDILPVP